MTLPSVTPLPTPQALTTRGGGISTAGYQFLQSLLQGAKAALNAVGTVQGQTDADTFSISFPTNQAYRVQINAAFGYTITSITSRCTSGTCTATFDIGGVNLGGGANSVSSSEQTKTHASANVVAIGDDLTCTISSNSSCQYAIFEIAFTRT